MLTIRQRKRGGPWHVRGTVRVGGSVKVINEHTTGTRDRQTAEVYLQKLQAEIAHSLLFKFGGDPTKAGRVAHAGSSSFVYFLRSGDLIKIGVTNDVKRRRELIQNAHGQSIEVVAVVQGDRTVEQILHAVLSPYRAAGEWYRLPPEIARSVADLGKWRGRKKGWQILGNAFYETIGVKAKNSVATDA